MYDIMYGKIRDFTVPLVVKGYRSFCEPERSHPDKSEHADFEFTIQFLVKRRFLVVHDKDMCCKKVYHHLVLYRILHSNLSGVQDIHQHQSKYSLKVSSVLC